MLPWTALAFDNYGFQDHISVINGAEINWTKGWITAPGLSFAASTDLNRSFSGGVPERRSQLHAARALFQAVMNLPWGHPEKDDLTQLAAEDKGLENEVRDLASQAQVSEVLRLSGNGLLFETYLRLDMQDTVLRMLMPDIFFMSPEFSLKQEKSTAVAGDCVIFLDASETALSAAVAPSILDEQGSILFRASVFGSRPEKDARSVAYAASGAEPLRFRPVQIRDQALWIRSSKASGFQNTCPVLDEQAAGRFMDMLSLHQGRCSVLILIK
ncbi:MAG: hypothetical protein ACOCV7_00390 [Desulfonatronovibrionaceae bacterium]